MENNPLHEKIREPFAKEEYAPSKPQSATRLGNPETPAPNVIGKGSDPYARQAQEASTVYQRATRKFSSAYGKTTEKVNNTYCKARDYSYDHPGKAAFIALGIGMGIGFLLSTNAHYHTGASRIAQPVINAMTDVAAQFFQ